MPLLEIKDLVFRPGLDNAPILNGLSLALEPGEIHAILGTNGTGKSTLAYLIMGCDGYAPSAGELLFNDTLINDLNLHERAKLGITLAWQEPVRFEGIQVRDYLALGGKAVDCAQCLEMVGLAPEHYLSRMVDKSLSGGERKRIELASVLALSPKLALLDEPDSGIDMLSTKDIIQVITALRDAGSSVLLITHREEIAVMADRASQLCNGRIVCSGNPGHVAEFYKSRRCLVCAGEVCVDV